ncbi:MAG: metabolite traffic protein EboE [Deltaproteobacteria bacterium]|nr:metabolite traffic protein EboE [Deltaproteobacteria bacterium]
MKLQAQSVRGRPVHLTYCTNIHPGESWPEVFANVDSHVKAVKQRACPTQPMGVGLRLSHAATQALVAAPDELIKFRSYLEANELYVFTLNGFPYGPFHGQPVKEAVYRPDWLEPERVHYTQELAGVLAVLLPDRSTPWGNRIGPLDGSISTVPGCFRGRAAADGHAFATMAENLRVAAATLVGIRNDGGPTIGLALEPEPHCVFETTAEMVGFFERFLYSEKSALRFAELTGLDRVAAAEALRRHLGICLDACHAAVEYENPEETLTLLRQSGVPVFKVQISAGLRLPGPTPRALAALQPFVEGVYLHQTVVRRGEALVRHLDLPDALIAAGLGDIGDEWRIHFHVPVWSDRFSDSFTRFESTSDFLRELLALLAKEPITPHLEVETYTWDVLPAELRTFAIDEAIARELQWTLQALGQPTP